MRGEEKVDMLKLATVQALCLETWPDEDLMPFNLAVLLHGRIPQENKSFARAVEEKLCKPDGSLWDRESLEAAIGAVLRSRHPDLFEQKEAP